VRGLALLALATLGSACAHLVPAEPLIDPGAPAEARPLAATELVERLTRARSFLETVEAYRCRLEARERIGDVLVAKVLDLTLGHRPFRMAFELLPPSAEAGQKVFWDESWNDGELWVIPPGLAGALLGHLSLDPHGKLAGKGQRHPVTDIGLLRLVEQVEARWKDAAARDAKAWSVSTRLADRPATLIGFSASGPEGALEHVRVGLDDALGIPVYSALERATPEGDLLLEEYLYRDLEWTGDLAEGAFRP
jgi:hypothetical protein